MPANNMEEHHLDELSDEVYKKEKEWKKAIQTVLSGRDQQIASLKQQVADFQKQLENTLQILLSKEKEITMLENTIRDLRLSLENEKSKTKRSEKRVRNDFMEKLREKDLQIEKLKENFSEAQAESRERYAKAIHQLTKEYANEVESLENELNQTKKAEKELQTEIEETMKLAEEKKSLLQSKENMMAKMENELKETKTKLSKSYNNEAKLIQTIKENETILQELKEENASLKIENKEVQNEIFKIINEVYKNINSEANMNSEMRKDLLSIRDMFVDFNKENLFIKNTLVKISNDFLPQLESVGVQVNINLTDISFEDTIIILKKRVSELTENEIRLLTELQNLKALAEKTCNQNLLLREVVKNMKKDKEVLLKEKQMDEDERRIRRLEDSVQIIKTRMTGDNCGDGIWVVLNEMKDDLKGLKGKSWHKVTKVNPVLQEVLPNDNNTAPQAFNMPLQPTVIPCSMKNLPMQVPKMEENIIRNRQKRINHCVSFSNNT